MSKACAYLRQVCSAAAFPRGCEMVSMSVNLEMYCAMMAVSQGLLLAHKQCHLNQMFYQWSGGKGRLHHPSLEKVVHLGMYFQLFYEQYDMSLISL